MTCSVRSHRAGLSLLLGIVSAIIDPIPSHAQSQKECVTAYEQAQVLRGQFQLRAAREQLLVCAQSSCPKVVTHDCAQWVSEIDADTSTIVLSAKDEQGRELTTVRVKADGVKLLDSLDGKAIPIDPGPHVFRFERGPQQSVEERVVIHQGERNRAISVVMQTGREPPLPPKSAPSSGSESLRVLPILAGSLGVLGMGSFAYFGISGRAEINHLRAECAPQCNQSDVDSARTKLLIADASLGVGIVSLGVATWLLLSQGHASGKQPKTQLIVHPIAQGGAAQLAVRFE